MKKEEIKLNNESLNNNEEIKLLSDNNTIDQDNIILNNELLSSIFKNPPHFEKIYKNEELNKFKDEILIYLSERNNHYMSLIKHFKDKMEENKLEYINQINNISLNYNSILSSQALLNNKLDKFSNFELFINKTNDQLITHEIRINNLYSDFIKSTQKYDKIYLDNLELPGYIGKFAKFKNCQMFFEHVIKEIDKINQYKEKNNLDLKAYKEKLDGIIKSFHLLVKNSNEGQMKYIKQLNDKSLRECKDMNDLLSNRVSDLRIENAKYSIELIKKNEEMNREWKKILEIKDNLLNSVNEKINNFKNIFNTNVNSFINFKKEFEDFQIKFNEISTYYKEIKNDNTNNNINNNNNINVNLNNNSCGNYTGWYISSNPLPVEKKNWKNFPRKFPKRSKTKNKYLEKKQFIKSISNLNPTNKQINEINNNKKENIDEYKSSNIIKLEDSEIKLNKEKEKETKKRNVGNSLNKEKTINSIEKYKYNTENQSKRSVSLFKEPHSCKNVTKIEINSHDKIYNFEQNKKEENKNKNNLLNKLNEEKTNIKTNTNINNSNSNNNNNNKNNNNNNNNSINNNNNNSINNNNNNSINNNNNNNNSNNDNNIKNNNINNNNDNNRINTFNNDTQKILINSDSNKNIKNLSSSSNKNVEKEKEKEKEKIIIHKFNKNKKSILQSNKSVQSDDLENNSISNINLGNSNTLNTTNDINYSLYSTNSICNVNKFVLNDGILDANDRVIKELASELEQSTNKKDKLASNKKKIEENFKVICNNIAPLNLNKTNGQKEYIQKGFSTIINYNENDMYHNDNLNNNLNIGDNVKINTISTEKTEEPQSGNNNNICTININQNDYNTLNKKMDIFDKKLIDLESLLKEKVIDILLQMDNLQNLCYYSLNNQKKPINQKLNNVNNTLSNHSNMNINGPNDLLNNNIKNHNSHDDYFIHSHSVKRLAPIIEIDPNNLQFSPSPTKTLNVIISNTKSKEQNKNKGLRSGFSSNFKDIKLFRKNDNKENMRTLSNMDNWDITKFKLITKNGNGVNKWINLNKLIKYEQSKTANISSNNGGLLATGNYDNNK